MMRHEAAVAVAFTVLVYGARYSGGVRAWGSRGRVISRLLGMRSGKRGGVYINRTLVSEALVLARERGWSLLGRLAEQNPEILYPLNETIVERLVERLRRGLDLARIILEASETRRGYLDLSKPLSDHRILLLASAELYFRYRGSGVGKVLVPEASGVPLATALAQLLEADVVIARRSKGDPYREYYEAHASAPPSIHRLYYVPRDLLGEGDRVLVVDDLVQSGYTLAAMRRLVELAGADLVGVAALVVVGGRWRSVVGELPVEGLVWMEV